MAPQLRRNPLDGGNNRMGPKGKNEGSVQTVSSVADIEALPTTTDAILVSRLDDSKAKALGRLRHLRILYQDGSPTGLTDLGVAALAQLPILEVLDLEWADDVTDHGLATLHHVPRLRWIDMAAVPVYRRMLYKSSGAQNLLWKSMASPPSNKRLKLPARVGYGMTTLSPARRSLSAIR